MKKILMTLLCACTLFGIAKANDRPITVDQLPATAQKFIKAHFPKTNVSLAKMDTDLFEKSYEVIFVTGDKLEFDSNGNWTEVDCKHNAVPVAIIPQPIQQYVKQNYPSVVIISIERDKREYEVKLNNRLELTFDTQYRLIDIDD